MKTLYLLAFIPSLALAGGSNYGVAPGSRDIAGKITEVPMSGGPYGLSIDKQGRIWVCRMGANAPGIYDPKTGKTEELRTGSGSRPRRIATAPDGMLWVT